MITTVLGWYFLGWLLTFIVIVVGIIVEQDCTIGDICMAATISLFSYLGLAFALFAVCSHYYEKYKNIVIIKKYQK